MQKNYLNKISAQFIKGVGPEVKKLLEKCRIETVQDVLFHFPFRYQDRTKLTPVKQVRQGEWVVVEGEIIQIEAKNRRTAVELYDGTGVIFLLFFQLGFNQKLAFKEGLRLRCFGEVKFSSHGKTLFHPEYQRIDSRTIAPIENTLTPIYPSTEGLTQTRWRKISEQALSMLNEDNLPDYLYKFEEYNFGLTLQQALKLIHRPTPGDNVELLVNKKHPAQLRLAFEELLSHHLSLKMKRETLKKLKAPLFDISNSTTSINQFITNLGFQLTAAQKRVMEEILGEFQHPHPMLRLVQGDVGCGKTVIAAICTIVAHCNHYQTAVMAPTEILTEQHLQNFKKWLEPLGIDVYCLNQKLKLSEKKTLLEIIKSQNNVVIIGTHALFQENVEFKNLGLVIIDEQHRFGVEQRFALKQKGLSPHQLMMTATPIPRTLAMTCYADLNHSIIDELPPNRTPIKTVVVSQQRREEIIQRIRHANTQKRQIYWVCTLIEESELLQCQAAEKSVEFLKQSLPDLTIQLIHGKLKPQEKDRIMMRFKDNQIDILVATTVIEVGVDVPNASVMIIENAERLGLSQLHQLRGRVGRGSLESYCILLYQLPLSFHAEERLRVMKEFQDGFKIAEKDLSLRGPGEFLGTRQTGMLNLRVADLVRDQPLFDGVQKTAELIEIQHPDIIQPIIHRWVGDIQKFQEV